MSEKIIEKLRKLMKHEESAKSIGNIGEAENFAGKIQELLMKYKLAVTDIEIEEEQTTDELTIERITPVGSNRNKMINWHITLLTGIARANNCDASAESNSSTLTLYGYESDIQLCITLFKYFVGLGEQLSMMDYINEAPRERHDHWRKSWLSGYASAVRTRFINAKYDAMKKANEANTSTALVHLRDKDKMVKEFVKHFGLSAVKSKQRMNAAYHRGHEQGSTVALTDKKIQ